MGNTPLGEFFFHIAVRLYLVHTKKTNVLDGVQWESSPVQKGRKCFEFYNFDEMLRERGNFWGNASTSFPKAFFKPPPPTFFIFKLSALLQKKQRFLTHWQNVILYFSCLEPALGEMRKMWREPFAASAAAAKQSFLEKVSLLKVFCYVCWFKWPLYQPTFYGFQTSATNLCLVKAQSRRPGSHYSKDLTASTNFAAAAF